jgi:DNA-binding transcriptional LysR family regulator
MHQDDVRKLDGGLLLIFRELIRHGSATIAARHLGLSQPAVSHALRRLRNQLADPLFLRRPHGLEPTERARDLAPIVDAIIELAGQLRGHDDAFDPATATRTFRIAAPEFVTATIGGPLLARWRDRAPQVALQTVQLDRGDVVDGLRRGRLDLAIGRFPPDPRPGIHTELLYDDEYCVVARRNHPVIRSRLTGATYLAAHHVIATGASEIADDDPIRPDMRIIAIVPAWLTALSIVSTSDAIATCPRLLADQHGARLDLRTLPVPGGKLPIVIQLHRRDGPIDPATTWLTTELRQAIRDTRRPSAVAG